MPLPDKARSSAILIGTSVYRDPALPDLPSVANNLKSLHAVITDTQLGAFTAQNCTLIENGSDQSRVARDLARVAALTDDVLFVYYSGHGLVGSRRYELFLGLSETEHDLPQFSSLPFAWVREVLLDSVATTKVLVLDCCFSGLAIDGLMADTDSLVAGQLSVRGTYTLTSTPANAAALAPPGARYTAFSGELITMLRDGISNGPKELGLNLIYQRLTKRMSEEGWPRPRQLGTDNVHELALGTNPAHTSATGLVDNTKYRRTSDDVNEVSQPAPSKRNEDPARPQEPREYRPGRVKWWSPEKKFGFLTDENGIDHFIHHSVLPSGIENLNDNEHVEFIPGQGMKGPIAQELRRTRQKQVQPLRQKDDSYQLGRVKWWDPEKRFGFLISDDGVEHYIPPSVLESGTGDLLANERIEFVPREGRRGPQASQLRRHANE